MFNAHDLFIRCLRQAGCKCEKPLLGFTPNTGPRCRLCNTQYVDENSLCAVSNIPEIATALNVLWDYDITPEQYKELLNARDSERKGWLCN